MKKFLFALLLFFTFSIQIFGKEIKILLGSPVCQKPNILKEFLLSLKELNKDKYSMDYFFIDDNKIQESKNLLQAFSSEINSKCFIIQSSHLYDNYVCDDNTTHYWTSDLIWKVAEFKNIIIKKAIEDNYDYLFLIDSDLVLHPDTINQLINANKDIISNIFWTSWYKNAPLMPQVWMCDEYQLYEGYARNLSNDEINKRTNEFLNKLKVPGIYEVGGLGACTLLSKNALRKGVSFEKIKNLSFWGEDRHFCVRAIVLGIPLFVDTHLPAYHIYREEYLNGVQDYKNKNKNLNFLPKITLSMIVKNEANRYLKEVLEAAKEYIFSAVIIDDASTDNTVEICKEILSDIPLTLIENKNSTFSNEYILRKQQFEETIKTNPEWILVLDADEIFEKKFKDKIFDIIANTKADAIYFRLYDFWDENHYRDDKYWSGHTRFWNFLIRYNSKINYEWLETPVHCGRFPKNISDFPYELSDLRIKHYGWMREEDRLLKYKRYMESDPLGTYGWKEQYDSILDKNPNLVEWIE